MACSLYLCPVMPIAKDQLRSLPVSDQEWADVNRYRHPADRTSRILAHALKRQVLAGMLRMDPHSLRFARDQYGKPHLLNASIAFSVTHTRQQVAVAATVGAPEAIGLDVEQIDSLESNEVETMADSILNPGELDRFHQQSDPRSYLLQCWTAKEAVLKAIGHGMQQGPLALAIKSAPPDDHCQGWRVSVYQASRMSWMSLAQQHSRSLESQSELNCNAIALKGIDAFNALDASAGGQRLMPVKCMYVHQHRAANHRRSQGRS